VDLTNPVERRAQSAVRCSDRFYAPCLEKIVTGNNTVRNEVNVSDNDNRVYRARRHSSPHDKSEKV
jgi:hypothetical protein